MTDMLNLSRRNFIHNSDQKLIPDVMRTDTETIAGIGETGAGWFPDNGSLPLARRRKARQFSISRGDDSCDFQTRKPQCCAVTGFERGNCYQRHQAESYGDPGEPKQRLHEFEHHRSRRVNAINRGE